MYSELFQKMEAAARTKEEAQIVQKGAGKNFAAEVAMYPPEATYIAALLLRSAAA